MKLIIEISDKETAAYADTIGQFIRTLGGSPVETVQVATPAPVAPVAQPAQSVQPAAPAPMPQPDDEPATVSSNPPAVDSTGLPWDERIHSATKSTVANGQWRRKKGVPDELVAQVEAQLRGAVAQPAQQIQPADPFAQFMQQTAQPATPAPVAQPVQPAAPAPMPQPMQAMAPLDAQQTAAFFAQQPAMAPATAPTSPAPADFPSFMKVLAGAVAAQKVDPAYINGLCQQLGIGAIADLMGNTALIPVAYNKLITDGKI